MVAYCVVIYREDGERGWRERMEREDGGRGWRERMEVETRALFGNFFGNNGLISLEKNFRAKFANDVIFNV